MDEHAAPNAPADTAPLAGVVDLLGTLTGDFDLDEYFQRVFEHARTRMPVSAVALVLGDSAGRPGVVSMDQASEDLEELQLDTNEGPCLDCFHTGKPVAAPDLAHAEPRWRDWTDAATARGYRSAYSTPLVSRSIPIGALNVFSDREDALDPGHLLLAQALADTTTIAIVTRRSGQLVDQLQQALDSRVVIEQAKGILAGHPDLDLDQAFDLLRRLARTTNSKLTLVAAKVVDGSVTAEAILAAFGRPPSRG